MDVGATTPQDQTIHPSCDGKGMCVANAHTMLVSLNLGDMPVGYAPALGPAASFRFIYNQKEAGQPASFNYGNVGPKWTHNFLSYIEDDTANPGLNVKRVVAGGGYVVPGPYNAGSGAFAVEPQSRGLLTRTPVSGTASSYTLTFPDGSAHGYSQLATGTPHRLFLKTITDPQGKALTLNYDSQNRLTSLVDAAGRTTTLSYDPTNTLLVTAITDPFGRVAALTYDSYGRLIRIKDPLNIESNFVYGSNSTSSALFGFIAQLTTPYGTSNFAYGEDSSGEDPWLELTDPTGATERLQSKITTSIADTPATPTGISITAGSFSQFNSIFWDRHANTVEGHTNTNSATITHWLNNDKGQIAPIAGAVKPPLDSYIFFNYPGQPYPERPGTLASPSAIGRVLPGSVSQVTQLTYNSLVLPLTTTDPAGRVTTQSYDTNGIDPKVTQQKISATAYGTTGSYGTYNSQHRPASYTDAAGKVWNFAYTADGQIATVTSPSPVSQTVNYGYDTSKRLVTITDANNVVVQRLNYPCASSTTGLVNCNLPDWIKSYDGVDAAGYQRSYLYDKLDRVTQVTYPDGTTELFDYSFGSTFPVVASRGTPSLDLWKYTDRMGRITTYDYDQNRRRIKASTVAKVGGADVTRTTQYAYYANGALKDLTDANGNVTHWAVDIQGRPTSKTYGYGTALAKTESYAYDSAGRLSTVTDALGQVKTIAYNADNSPASYTYSNPVDASFPTPNVSFAYDPYWPRRTSMTDMSGLNSGTGQPASATTSYTYAALGSNGALNLETENNGGYYNQNTGYYYDAAGRLTQQWASESQAWFSYDSLGRVANYGTDIGLVTYGYLGETGLRASRAVSNGTTTLTTTYGYDATANDRRLLTINHNNTAVRSFTLAYSVTGDAGPNLYNIRQITEATGTAHPLGAQKWLYGYDKSDRLLSAAATTTNGSYWSSIGSYSYGYDKLDNLASATYPEYGGYTDTPTTNGLNQQTQNAWWQNFAYDGNGNTTREYDDAGHDMRTYKWDMEGRLLQMTDPRVTGGYTVRYHYDGLGRRILQKTTSGSTVTYKRYLWCGMQLCQQRDTGTASIRRYFAEGEYVNAVGATSAKKYLYMQDHLGSVRDLVDAATGNRVGATDYKPYGQIKATDGIQPDFQYAGLLWVPEIGLNASSTRFYDGGPTRWMNRDWDRVAGLLNGYGYVRGNPIMRTDVFGTRDTDVYVWNWVGIPGPGGGRVGHIMVTEANSTDVLLSQFPHQIGEGQSLRGPNWRYSYDETMITEGVQPDAVYRVFVPDDGAFDQAVANQAGRKFWDMNPDGANETHCTRAAYDALRDGGVTGMMGHSTGQILPGTLGDLLEGLSKSDPAHVRRISIPSLKMVQ